MPVQLLHTRLYVPPVRPEMVSRPRLIERLNVGLERKLTLISASAGFGKTTLLRWSEALPEELMLARPGLRMYQGWATFLNRQTALAERILQDAKQALQATPSPPSLQRYLEPLCGLYLPHKK